MLNVFIRTITVYALLVTAMRIGGKRQIGELQLSELVTALLLSEIASMPIGHDDIPLAFAVIPVLTVICLELITSFAVTKSKFLKNVFDGNPSFVIRKGKLDVSELSKLHMSVTELMSEARLQGISDLSDLEYAILEQNGQLSVFEKAEQGQTERGIAHAVIVDGCINEHAINALQMNEASVRKRLSEKKAKLRSVFLYTVNDAGEEYWVFKGKGKK